MNEPAFLKNYILKIEMHKIDLQVAEFAISIMEDGDNGRFSQKLAV